jgi:small nuclear ribonucleoprotein (snRNP)-like protein
MDFFSNILNNASNAFNTATNAITNTANNFESRILNTYNALQADVMPPDVKAILDRYGNQPIKSISIGRTPVQAVIQGIVKNIGNVPYDNLFHLFIIITTENGTNVSLEKNARIKMLLNPERPSERLNLPVSNLTINELYSNTESFMGERFYPYSSKGNNCQNFILSVLQANNILTPESIAFVKQDTDQVFQEPMFRKLANSVTDLGKVADIVFQGGHLTKGVIQSVLISRNIHLDDAKELLHKLNLKCNKVDITKHYYRFRQIDPLTLKHHGFTEFRTIPIEPNVQFIKAYKL